MRQPLFIRVGDGNNFRLSDSQSLHFTFETASLFYTIQTTALNIQNNRIITFILKSLAMPRIAGVTTQKDTKGNITHVTINLKKHRAAVPALQQLGLMEKDQFDIDFENGMTIEEFRQKAIEHINSLPWKE